MAACPEPIRRIPVRGTWAYLDRLGAAPGSRLDVHVSAEAAHEIELVRLGRGAVLDPAQPLDADRLEARRLAAVARPEAARQSLTPGSYIHVGGPPVPAGPLTLALWVRLLQMPQIDIAQIGWQGVITDIDYPDAARFGLLFDHMGRISAYVGDGGAFRHERLHHTAPMLGGLVGRWAHVAASWSGEAVRIFVDGAPVLEAEAMLEAALPAPAAGERSRLRIGAMAEGGEAADFLDGDIAQPFIGGFLLDAAGAARLAADGGRSDPTALGLGPIIAAWPLAEERGTRVADTVGERPGTIVNHATWMVGGPRFDAARRMPLEYRPAADPDHGHGLRLSGDDIVDAGWPVACSFDIPADAESGLYAVRIRLAGQPAAEATVAAFVVSRRRPRRAGSLALMAATNTWHAYGRRPRREDTPGGLNSSFYTRHLNGRPFFHIGTRLPIPNCHPYAFESERSTRTRSTHAVRTERHMEAWLAREGYAYEVITDYDLHQEPDLLQHFQALVLAGHSEYWTDEMRAGVLRYLAAGGRLLSLSGDTMTVRMTIDDSGTVMECRKIVFDEDERFLPPSRWGESWHSHDQLPGGSYRRLGKPSWDVLGMSFKGMIDDGIAGSFWPYTVLKPDHVLFHEPEPVPIGPDGRIGLASLNGSGGASGYEYDANPDVTGMGPAPMPGVETLASALGQQSIEWVGRQGHGADLIHWRRPDGGIVVNFGSIAAGGSLAVDAGMAALVRNVLAHFGIARERRA